MPISEQFRSCMLERLQLLYGDEAGGVLQRIDTLADRYAGLRGRAANRPWDERSVTLITYGDQVREVGRAALEAQRRFLLDYEIDTLVSAVHILPFFPYSSDDGFSVVDYCRVNPDVGGWPDVERLGESFGMTFDLVVNHCSRSHDWFARYLAGEEPYTTYFHEVDPATDLSAVTRPRSTPPLTAFETSRGTRHVWTTFSADQVDLNYESADLLLEALDILLLYIEHGATVIRLDAIGFLWKTVGTTCMHLPETHAVVKLIRSLVDDVAPGTVLLTETNVPHEENVSYFGDGDEAHAVYQFSLAPLLLDAFLTGDAGALGGWLTKLEYPGPGMTFFNFTASHDGIGVRPLEGLVSQQRLDALVESVRERGGLVSMRKEADGSESPYELNITYLSALDTPEGLAPEVLARKFLASQGVMLALRGVPGVYFHSLVGTRNYADGVDETGQNRAINRRKFDSGELRQIVSGEGTLERRVFDGYRRMLAVRVAQRAFHPDGEQTVLDAGHDSVIAFRRSSLDGKEQILVLANVGGEAVTIRLEPLIESGVVRDLLGGRVVESGRLDLAPYDIAWLA